MRSQPELPDYHLQFLKALTRPTDYQRLLLELIQKTDRTPIEDKKLIALIKTEKANIRAMKAKQQVNNLLNAEKAQQRKARTKRLIELGALFDIAHLAIWILPPSLACSVTSKSHQIAPNGTFGINKGFLILQDRKQAKNAKQEQSVHEND